RDFALRLHDDTDVGIKAGTRIVLDNEMANRLVSAGARGDEFEPERWRDEAFDLRRTIDNLKQGSQIRTFTSGPRVCPGRMLATMSVAKLVGTLASQYTMSCDAEEISMD